MAHYGVEYHENHADSLVRYETEPPNLAELEASAQPGLVDSSARILCEFVENNLSLLVSGFFLLLLLYMTRPQVPDARFRGRFRRQMRELKEALAEKPAEREQRIEEALTVKVSNIHYDLIY